MPDIGNSNELGFNFGMGFKTRSTGMFGLRLDARNFVGRTPSFGLARHSNDPTATVLPATGVTNNLELSVGVVFYFSRR
jgi:outer membrane protein assembly factor BamA